MSESAEALAANLKSSRNVTIEITNLTNTYCLIDPNKSSGKASGAVGVLTYDLFERHNGSASEKLAIMFSVPYDNSSYKNWLAIAIYAADKKCDEDLYKEMYYDKEPTAFVREEAKGCGLTFEGHKLDIKATMSPLGRSMLKVEVWDKLFTSQKH
ncbi:DELTA-sagatoxin-Srs1a [Liparis tanakae]|uniref:DELTA-sagatoxin-Srs1a n=1 Tax=Liparis tanakae TaxID=230148 RepID=A0A4Z2EWE7_9TELE|nr:DELTA-sagatoxin-Srs1a [Liparis tanakae]